MIIDIILEIFEKMRLIDLIKIRILNKTYKHYIDLIFNKKITKTHKQIYKHTTHTHKKSRHS